MHGDIERHNQMIEASGMGFLPGIGLAFLLCMVIMAALLVQTWWVMVAVLVSLFAVAGVVVWVIVKLIGADGTAEH